MKNEFIGSWQQVSCIDLGGSPSKEQNADVLVEFSENEFVVSGTDGSILIKGNYSLDTNHNPKWVDWFDTFGEDTGKTFLAIYKVENDQLTFSAADDGKPRPPNFDPIPGHTIRTHKRV